MGKYSGVQHHKHFADSIINFATKEPIEPGGGALVGSATSAPKTYFGDEAPSSPAEGDIWIDSRNGPPYTQWVWVVDDEAWSVMPLRAYHDNGEVAVELRIFREEGNDHVEFGGIVRDDQGVTRAELGVDDSEITLALRDENSDGLVELRLEQNEGENTLEITNEGEDVVVSINGALALTAAHLPVVDPEIAGVLWNNNGVPTVSAG